MGSTSKIQVEFYIQFLLSHYLPVIHYNDDCSLKHVTSSWYLLYDVKSSRVKAKLSNFSKLLSPSKHLI